MKYIKICAEFAVPKSAHVTKPMKKEKKKKKGNRVWILQTVYAAFYILPQCSCAGLLFL